MDGGKWERREDLFVNESVDELDFWGWFVLGVVKLDAELGGGEVEEVGGGREG